MKNNQFTRSFLLLLLLLFNTTLLLGQLPSQTLKGIQLDALI
ncbi:MAG: hypothetical protein AAFO94_15555 [Bacteroidota bacterium]